MDPITNCHPERSEGIQVFACAGDTVMQARTKIPRFARDDKVCC